MVRTAFIVGASGLVGRSCLRALLECPEYGRVIAAGRRPLGVAHSKLVEGEPTEAVDDAFCAIGTTIKKAGSREAFRAVDYEIPVRTAERCGARRFVVVSSVGADARSKNFYLRVKGEMEEAVSALPLEAVHIFRPSILVGDREESRAGEKVGAMVARALRFALVGGLRRYRPIAAEVVGRAMVVVAVRGEAGRHVYEYGGIVAMGGR